MATRNQVTVRHSAEIAILFQKAGVSGKKLLEMFPQYSKATIYRHAKKPIGEAAAHDKRKDNKGRPSKLTPKDKRRILRSVQTLRATDGSFTSPRIAVEAGVESKVSNRTIRRVLKDDGYSYLRSRKKGLMTKQDLKSRMRFCKKVRKLKLGQDFWNRHISFYLDGKGFEFKTNPLDQAKAPRAREWRKKSEGLRLGCTAKGRKEGAVNSNFMIAISYNHGVVLCEQYFGAITGSTMERIIHSSFPQAFEESIKPKGKRFLQDGCPRQNCKKAMDAYDAVGAKVFKIPSRSPDRNPIENFFNCISMELRKQALEKKIRKETFEQFSARVKKTMLDYPTSKIDKIIETMDKRIGMVIEAKGMRIKY